MGQEKDLRAGGLFAALHITCAKTGPQGQRASQEQGRNGTESARSAYSLDRAKRCPPG